MVDLVALAHAQHMQRMMRLAPGQRQRAGLAFTGRQIETMHGLRVNVMRDNAIRVSTHAIHVIRNTLHFI